VIVSQEGEGNVLVDPSIVVCKEYTDLPLNEPVNNILFDLKSGDAAIYLILIERGVNFVEEETCLGEDELDERVGVDVLVGGEELLQTAETFGYLEPIVALLRLSQSVLVEVLHHFYLQLLVGHQLEHREQRLLNQQVVVGLYIGKAHRIFELFILKEEGVRTVLLLDVAGEVIDDIIEFKLDDAVELSVNVGSEVVQSVDETANVAFEGPAPSRLYEVPHQILERVSLEQFTDVDDVVVIDKGRHNLEESAEIG
jgi:hypothetical protein